MKLGEVACREGKGNSLVWSGSSQDNQTPFCAVPADCPKHHTRSGVTLTELLVVLAVIAVLVSLALPAWRAITRSHANNAAMSLAMGTLEQARLAAVSGKKEVWVVLRNEEALKKGSLRLVTRDGNKGSALQSLVAPGNWIQLPRGITFQTGEGTLMDQHPPAEVIATALGGSPSQGLSLGGVMFQRSGRIGIPQQGGPGLSLRLKNHKGPLPSSLELARGSGRANLRNP